MPFCSNCGSPVDGRFCTKCGAPAGGSGPQAPPAASDPGPAKAELAQNMAAAICYVPGFVIAVIFLLWAPYNKDRTIRFHAFQSIFVQACYVAALVVLGVLLSPISEPLWFGLQRLLDLAAIVLLGFMIWKTWQKEEIVLPYLGPLARKQA